MQEETNNFFLATSWDDGHKLDLKIAELLKRYNLPGIFYIPSNCQLSEEEIKQLSEDFEIGGHTATHPPDMKLLSPEQLESEVQSNKDWLEAITGKEITKFCYPKGKYDDVTIDALIEAGYKEARTVLVMNTDFPDEPFRTHTSIHVYPNRKEYNNRPWLEVAKFKLKEAMNKPEGYFHLFGHSWEIEKFHLWDELEQFLKVLNDVNK